MFVVIYVLCTMILLRGRASVHGLQVTRKQAITDCAAISKNLPNLHMDRTSKQHLLSQMERKNFDRIWTDTKYRSSKTWHWLNGTEAPQISRSCPGSYGSCCMRLDSHLGKDIQDCAKVNPYICEKEGECENHEDLYDNGVCYTMFSRRSSVTSWLQAKLNCEQRSSKMVEFLTLPNKIKDWMRKQNERKLWVGISNVRLDDKNSQQRQYDSDSKKNAKCVVLYKNGSVGSLACSSTSNKLCIGKEVKTVHPNDTNNSTAHYSDLKPADKGTFLITVAGIIGAIIAMPCIATIICCLVLQKQNKARCSSCGSSGYSKNSSLRGNSDILSENEPVYSEINDSELVSRPLCVTLLPGQHAESVYDLATRPGKSSQYDVAHMSPAEEIINNNQHHTVPRVLTCDKAIPCEPCTQHTCKPQPRYTQVKHKRSKSATLQQTPGITCCKAHHSYPVEFTLTQGSPCKQYIHATVHQENSKEGNRQSTLSSECSACHYAIVDSENCIHELSQREARCSTATGIDDNDIVENPVYNTVPYSYINGNKVYHTHHEK